MQMSEQGSVTGRWAHQRITGKSVALGMAYGGSMRENLVQAQMMHMNFENIEKRMRLRWVLEERIRGGKRHTMKRPHDRNTNARLRFGQAILLGWQIHCQRIEQDAGMYRPRIVRRWWAEHEQRAAKRLGPFKTRHHAVVAALRDMGVEA